MLEVFRRHSQSFLIYVIFGTIIVVFAINFGPGSGGCTDSMNGQWAASVNGENIRQQDFTLTYNRRLDGLRRNAQQAGRDFTPEMAERLGLKKQVIDQLVERKLLSHEAQKWDIVVSDADLLKYLQDRYGVKDVSYQDYDAWVSNTFQMTVSAFEEDVRSEILAQRFLRVLADNLSVSDEEIKDQYLHDNDRAKIYTIEFEAVEKDKPTASAQDKQNFDVAAKAKAEGLLSQLKSGATLESLTTPDTESTPDKPMRHESSWIQKGQDAFFGLGTSKELHDEIFGLTLDSPVANKVVKVENRYVVAVLKERETPDLKKFDEQKIALRETALAEKRNTVLRAWIDHLRDSSEIKLNPVLFASK
jgi:hypothetical protein